MIVSFTITNDAGTSLAYLLGTNIDVYAFELDKWGIYQFEFEPMAKRHITNTNQSKLSRHQKTSSIQIVRMWLIHLTDICCRIRKYTIADKVGHCML